MPIPTPSADPLFTGQIRPPDVPPYVPRAIAYATGTNPPVFGDGTATGGFGPYWADQPADIPTPDREDWVKAGPGSVAFAEKLCIGYGGTEDEAKFRTHAEFKGVFSVDPIRAYGLPGGSHLHAFWGAYTPSAVSTRETNRTFTDFTDGSGAAGGRNNNTAYWMPPLLFDKDDVTYAITPGTTIIYYTAGPAQSIRIHPLFNGVRYVSGVDMEYPTRITEIVAQANADAGFARYRPHVGQGTDYDAAPMWHKWSIEGTPGSGNSRYLINPDGSNPFEGVDTVSDGATGLQLEFDQGLAWDGDNPWSPRGYDHVMPLIYDTEAEEMVPPLGWYRLAAPQYNMIWDLVQLETFLGGPFADFNPRLSSDAHLNMLGLPGKGHSVHFDYLESWDETTRRQWETNGIGCGPLGGAPHAMGDSLISADEALLSSGSEVAPDGKVPQVDLSRSIQIYRLPADPKAVTTATMA